MKLEAQLWAKELPLDSVMHRFSVGDDPETDQELLPFDALGSAAHARMLAKVGLLSSDDATQLVIALRRIAQLAEQKSFTISREQEDAHTAIEAELTRQLGPIGQRIHLGRSRNDQVILAMRLFLRDALLKLGHRLANLAGCFLEFAQAHQDVSLPGYTHLRRAMPSSFGLWGVAFAEALLEELEALQALYARLDRCPLGAAAGFGVPLPLDREYTAALLGFSKVQRSPIDVQNSRGRHELAMLQWVSGIALSLEKCLWDLSLFSMEEFGFLKLPDAFTTGSSIMPQKKNPDVIELARARCREFRGWTAMVEHLAGGLPSSYHRDFQLLKQPVMTAIHRADEWLEILTRLISGLEVNAKKAAEACGDELFAAHQAFVLVQSGLPFREAYRQVAQDIQSGDFAPDREALTATHLGGAKQLALDQANAEWQDARLWIEEKRSRHAAAADRVWERL
jgi:argininosuccinate lyase